MTDYDKLFEDMKKDIERIEDMKKDIEIEKFMPEENEGLKGQRTGRPKGKAKKPKRPMYKSYKWDIWKVMSKIPPGFTGAGGETKDAVIRKVGGSRSDVNNSITQMIDEKTLVYNWGKLSINPEIFGLLFEKRLEFLLFYTYIERDDDVSQIDMDSLTRDVEIYNERN